VTPLIAAALLAFGTISTKVFPVTAEVYVEGRGPYLFYVDTGSETTVIEPALAASLGLRPAFQTEIVSVTGSRFAPGTRVGTLRVGGEAIPPVEVLFDDPSQARQLVSGVRGVLGINALRHVNSLLAPREGVLRIGSAAVRPTDGDVVAVPLREVEGRLVIPMQMGRDELSLVLDSGANHVVLFRMPKAMARTSPVSSTVTTLDGARQAAATTWTAEMVVGDKLRMKTRPAVVVQRDGSTVDGLMPVAAFESVFVDRARNEVVLTPAR
jgi:predicted aspartyl protease